MPGKTPKKHVSVKTSRKEKGGALSTFSREIAPRIDPKIRATCLKCRGTKNLCGKSRCPVLAKFYLKVGGEKGSILNTDFLEGNSPPSIFIGRYGYPKISVGPLVPPQKGDTSILSTPEKWFGRAGMEDIIRYRGKLARGKKRLKEGVEIGEKLDREVERTRYIALSKKPAEAEVKFDRNLSESFRIDNWTQPHGPSGVMKSFETGTISAHRALEKIFYDDELKSEPAVINLYERGVRISKIQDIFMVGGSGLRDNRKFVPTRWSITAVDDIIGKYLRERIKSFRPINEYEVYTANYLDNLWTVILTPTLWRYELIEAFYPETTWNPSSRRIAIYGDHEYIQGRTDYASLGGCYYAARLAVGEKFYEEGRQGGAIVLREAHPGYILPVGVWNVRESVRNALRTQPRRFETRNQVFSFLSKKLDLDLEVWKSVSELLTEKDAQQKLEKFL